jgi:hypothetical protein
VTEGQAAGAGWLTVGIAAVADGLSLLSYVGLDDEKTAQVTIGLVLAAIGVIVAGSLLVRAVRVYVDPLGATIPGAQHRAKIGTAALTFLVALGFGVAVVLVALDDDDPKPARTSQTR